MATKFSTAAATCFILLALFAQPASASVEIDLKYELDGNSPLGDISFGTITITQNGDAVNFVITANTVNLAGGDIHEFAFNLPDGITGLTLSNSGGISNDSTIGTFAVSNGGGFNLAGKAGASFEYGVSFGNGAGFNGGNGKLTQATFTLSADQALSENDFVSELSSPSNTPDVYVAVHFQSADVFGAGSESVGGGFTRKPDPGTDVVPEASSLLIWTGLTGVIGLVGIANRRRRAC